MKNLITILVCSTIILNGQNNPGAKQISLSNSDIAQSNDVFSLFNNPAGLAQLNWQELGIFYSPAPFGLTELANGYIAFNQPTSLGSFSFGAMAYGFELYRESKILFGYSNKFQSNFFYGFTFNLHYVNIKNYGNDLAYFLNLGTLFYIFNDLRFGFYIENLNRATFSKDKEQIPTYIKTGFSYDLLPELSLNISVEKDLRYKASIQFGIDYDLIEYLSVRTGFSKNPAKYSAGLGINYSSFSLDYAFFSHNDLGLTHQLGLIISFETNLSRRKAIRDFLGVND